MNAEKFDQRIDAICRKYYKSSSGRPSITPETYFGMLLFGYDLLHVSGWGKPRQGSGGG